jgi:hypothetical protein
MKMGKMGKKIKQDYLVEKRNVLNEIRANGMSLQELRFFSIYLSKINPRDESTRVVRFSLGDFQRIMDFDSHIKIEYIKHVTDSLLCKVVNVPTERGGYNAFHLFTHCRVDPDENGEWYVEINAHDMALPLMFQFKEKYFTYQLWNALRLKSSNQLRMYEILKQYEKVGRRVIAVQELKSLLGIDEKEYPRYGDFRVHVLEVCRKVLEERTDIKFTYEPAATQGRGRKIISIKFLIEKNDQYTDPLSLEEFIGRHELAGYGQEETEHDIETDNLSFMAEACENEFSPEEVQVLYNLALGFVRYQTGKNNILDLYNYLKSKYDELNWRNSRTIIKNRFGYLKKILEADADMEGANN